jgi:hypothetical protein
MRELLIESASLATPRGRITSFVVLSVAIFFCRYHWLDHLSLWGNLGFSHAPSIGLTRAYWLFLHGQIVAAWQRNWLIYMVLATGLPMVAVDIKHLATKLTKSYSQVNN